MSVNQDLIPDETKDNRPELISQTEEFFFFCQNNMTQDAKNTVWKLLALAKQSYITSPHKKEWNLLLENLQTIMNDFHNDYSTKSELKLEAVHRNAQELDNKIPRHFGV